MNVSSRRTGPPPPPRKSAPAVVGPHRRRLLVVAVVLTALFVAAYGVSVSPVFDVDRLRVRGLRHLTAADVEAAGGVHHGDAMAWIDTGQAITGIEALPYVRRATLQRKWPDTVRITVRERRPSAWIDGPAGPVLVDRSGRVLETVDSPPHGMPKLVGARVVPPPGGRVDALAAARVAGALSGLAAAGTASVDLTEHGVVLRLVTGPEIRMGDATRIGVKLRAALAVLRASAGVPVAYVDVSVPTNPVAG